MTKFYIDAPEAYEIQISREILVNKLMLWNRIIYGFVKVSKSAPKFSSMAAQTKMSSIHYYTRTKYNGIRSVHIGIENIVEFVLSVENKLNVDYFQTQSTYSAERSYL